MKIVKLGLLVALLFSAQQIWAAAPACVDNNNSALPVNNSAVVNWKTSTQNQFLARAHVQGNVTRLYPDKNGHIHFEITLANFPKETLEVIYNEDFGTNPTVRENDVVEACGDYITSDAPAGPYPASPDGAIIHWIHQSPNPGKHPSGFLMINGTIYGQLSTSQN